MTDRNEIDDRIVRMNESPSRVVQPIKKSIRVCGFRSERGDAERMLRIEL